MDLLDHDSVLFLLFYSSGTYCYTSWVQRSYLQSMQHLAHLYENYEMDARLRNLEPVNNNKVTMTLGLMSH